MAYLAEQHHANVTLRIVSWFQFCLNSSLAEVRCMVGDVSVLPFFSQYDQLVSTIHAVLTEKQLEREYNTIELLLNHAEIAKFVSWIKNKPDGTAVPVRGGKKRER